MDDDDPLASLLGTVPQLDPLEAAELFPPDDAFDAPEAPVERDGGPAEPRTDTDDQDPVAELRGRLEFIRKELPPSQRREWMLRLLTQFRDLSENIALVNELNDYMRLAMEGDAPEQAFWDQTARAWDRPRRGGEDPYV